MRILPVSLKVKDKVKQEVTLIYELINDKKFIFLGGIEKFKATEPIPKLKINLEKDDILFTRGLIFVP